MIPGEVVFDKDNPVIWLNENRDPVELEVLNTSDRPIQVGSHYHFAEANPGLDFIRDKAWGRRLDIAAGTSKRFEPNIPQTVTLVRIVGRRRVPGLHGLNKDEPDTGLTDEKRLPHKEKGPNGELDLDSVPPAEEVEQAPAEEVEQAPAEKVEEGGRND
jgi:urease subunit beta